MLVTRNDEVRKDRVIPFQGISLQLLKGLRLVGACQFLDCRPVREVPI